MSDIKPTPGRVRALLILNNKQPHNATEFAELMWPDSVMHTMVSNQGHGAHRGKAAWLVGGSFLCRLAKEGLIVYVKTYDRRHGTPVAYLTAAGKRLLAEAK